MTKFLHIVEQNLPDSDYQDQLDLLMKFKEDALALYKSGKLDFFIAPIQGTGSVEIVSRDGKRVKLTHRPPPRRELAPSEEAEDPAMKENNPVADILKRADPTIVGKAKIAAAAVGRQLTRIAANTPK
jgi:hypothetical protein